MSMVAAQYVNLLFMMAFVAIVAGPIVASLDGWRLPELRLNRVNRLAPQEA